MKGVMYHYVRPHTPGLPNLNYLHIENFRRQLDWIDANIGFVSRDEFERSLEDHRPRQGAVLSFDDSFSDHHDFVLPELRSRGLWGVFYVPTLPYRYGQMLDVHRVHMILGAHSGERAMVALSRHLTDEMMVDRDRFGGKPYERQDNAAAVTAFKTAINYYVRPEDRSELLSLVMDDLFEPGYEREQLTSLYMTPEQIKALHAAGMIVGSHTVRHDVLSKLDAAEQRREIADSAADVSAMIGARVITFCYPHGKADTFTPRTEQILSDLGFSFSFCSIPDDIESAHLSARRQALPRHDCNAFPFGKAGLPAIL